MNETIYLPRVVEGERNLARLVGFFSALPKENAYEVTVKLRKNPRSISQNRKLWALYNEIIRKGGESMAGWVADDLHEFFLQLHFGHEVKELFGRKRHVALNRSSKLTKLEFSDLLETIFRFMAERGVYLE
jgi:NinB protein